MLIPDVIQSVLFPLIIGNDLFVVLLSARHPGQMVFLAALATALSIAGSSIVAWGGRRAGAKKPAPSRHIPAVVAKRTGWAVGIAALMPPPFPLEPFVAAASFFGYPRARLFTVIGATRLVRYIAEGVLAMHHSAGVLAFFRSPVVAHTLTGLAVALTLGAVVCGWKRMRPRLPALLQQCRLASRLGRAFGAHEAHPQNSHVSRVHPQPESQTT